MTKTRFPVGMEVIVLLAEASFVIPALGTTANAEAWVEPPLPIISQEARALRVNVLDELLTRVRAFSEMFT